MGNFEKNPQEAPRSCFVGVAWLFFSPLIGTNSKITHYLLYNIFFSLNTLKDTTEALPVDHVRLKTLRGTKAAFFNH